jgi:hypothetical protein
MRESLSIDVKNDLWRRENITLAVVGSRGFTDYNLLKSTLDKLNIYMIVSGGAQGADKLAERYASENNIAIRVFKADWGRFGKQAGFIRNGSIITASTHVIAFWDGKSRGTEHSIRLANEYCKPLKVIVYDE